MKRTLASLLSLMALTGITMLSSCSKEDVGDGTQFRATMEGCAARDGKTTLSGMSLNWVSGDQVAIYGTAGCGIYTATPQSPATVALFDNVGGTTGDGPFRAFYPSTLTTDGVSITLPAAQTYVENSINEFPMYAESATNQLAFKNLCGVLKLHLTKANTNISSISVTANAEICGDFTVSYVNDVPYLSYAGNGSKTVTMACTTAQAIDNGRDFYIALPAIDTLKSITLTTDDGRYCTKTVKSNVCIGVQRSEMTTIVFLDNDMDFVEPLPEGALPGLFSVSATQQVRFSKGNLQYQASTDTWRFASNQYDYVGYTNSNISASYSGWIDLFGWGTGNNPTLASNNNADYSTFVDWGSNAISNGGNQPNTWRTLSRDEWTYLINGRPSAVQKRGQGYIANTYGLILIPDYNWVVPNGLTFSTSSQNNYTTSQWTEMENAGAIFLPSAGSRYGNWVEACNTYGDYWSSTSGGDDSYYLYHSYGQSPSIYYGYGRNGGRAVRLVRDNN